MKILSCFLRIFGNCADFIFLKVKYKPGKTNKFKRYECTSVPHPWLREHPVPSEGGVYAHPVP